MIINRALKRACLVGLGAVPVTSVFAHEPEDELSLTIVSANRLDSDLGSTTSNVGKISKEEIERSQRYLLRDILNSEPGLYGFSSAGQSGQTGSLAIQGLPTRYTQVSIDGVSLSGAGGSFALGNFLANTHTQGYSSVEVLKGGQSTNYGNAAAGGVIYLSNDYGNGETKHRVSGEIGSYNSWTTEVSTRGSLGDLRYNIGISKFSTANDLGSGQDFDNETFFSNFAYRFSNAVEAKFSVRTQNSEIENGGSPSDVDSVSLTGNIEFDVNPFVKSKVNFGRVTEDFSNFSTFGSFLTSSRINSIGVDSSFEVSDNGTLYLGAQHSSFERDRATDFGEQSEPFEVNSASLNYQHFITDRILLEGGVRYEDNTNFQDDIGFNLGGKFDLTDNIAFRARYSDSYRAPGPLETEAFPAFFQLANPDLEPETIRSWEAGIDWALSENHEFEVTGYYHRINNAISNPSFSQFVNEQGLSEVAGFTIAAKGSFISNSLNYNVSWDYLLKNDVTEFPRNRANLNLYYEGVNWLIGVGASTQSSGNFSGETDANFIARAYGNYEVNEYLTLNARLENIFDEQYVVTGFGDVPGTGTAFYFGATLEF